MLILSYLISLESHASPFLDSFEINEDRLLEFLARTVHYFRLTREKTLHLLRIITLNPELNTATFVLSICCQLLSTSMSQLSFDPTKILSYRLATTIPMPQRYKISFESPSDEVTEIRIFHLNLN